MKQYKGIVLTTHIDAHGEVVSEEDLEKFVKDASQRYVLIDNQHDPRYPPLGRIISARVIDLHDGGKGVEATLEIGIPTINKIIYVETDVNLEVEIKSAMS